MKTLGQKVREARNKKNMTLDELAQQSGTSKAYLSQLENGHSERPSAETLYKIAITLDVSMAELLGKKLKKVEEVDKAIPASLRKAANQFRWNPEDIRMLQSVNLRYGKNLSSNSVEDWRFIYETIKRLAGARG